jgi:hypothetical protein
MIKRKLIYAQAIQSTDSKVAFGKRDLWEIGRSNALHFTMHELEFFTLTHALYSSFENTQVG